LLASVDHAEISSGNNSFNAGDELRRISDRSPDHDDLFSCEGTAISSAALKIPRPEFLADHPVSAKMIVCITDSSDPIEQAKRLRIIADMLENKALVQQLSVSCDDASERTLRKARLPSFLSQKKL
jgi:hypothetical protein